MRDTDRAAMAAKLEAVEKILDAAQRLTPYSHQATERADKKALARIRRLLTEAEREARSLRWEHEPKTPIERAEIAAVPVAPEAIAAE